MKASSPTEAAATLLPVNGNGPSTNQKNGIDAESSATHSNSHPVSTDGLRFSSHQDIPCTSRSQCAKKRKVDNDESQVFRFTQRKYLRIDSWECGEKSHMISAIKELLENDDNIFYSEDPETIDTLVQKIKAKLDTAGGLMIAERRICELLKHFIRRLKRERPGQLEAVDKWLEIIRALTPVNKHLEQQLKSAIMVAIEEPIPQFNHDKNSDNLKKELPEPNFAAVYKYLACAVSAQPLPELSPIDALLVEDCMQSLIEQIKTLDDGDLRLNLRKLYLCLDKGEGQAPEEDEDDIFNQIANATLFNPFGINQNLIVPVPPE